MAVFDIKEFGGIRPSVSPRALPDNAAQTNDGLFLGTNEFRPLASDAVVGVGLSGAKLLYRFDSASPWITSTSDYSYARGQINGDTTKRTYYTNNTTPSVLRYLDMNGVDRQVGVPAPTATTATTTQGDVLTADALAEAIVAVIRAANVFSEPGARYSGSTILAGPTVNPGLYFATDTVNLPTQVTSLNHYWNLYAKVSDARVAALNLVLPDIEVTYAGGGYVYIPLMALPFRYVENGTPVATGLAAITNPRTSAVALSGAQVTALSTAILDALDPSENAYRQRTEITDVARDFYYYVFTYSPTGATIPDEGTSTDPTGDGPTMPTGPQYEDTGGGYELTAEWQTYYADLATYATNKEVYNQRLAEAGTETISVTDKIRELQARARALKADIEAIQVAQSKALVGDTSWALDKVYTAVASGTLSTVDPDRVTETRFYLTTFVNDLGEESAPSPPSDEQTTDQYSATVVSRPTVPSGRNLSYWRVYRSNTTGDLTTFQYVDEIAVGTASYTDDVSNEALGEIIPTIDWNEPPALLQGIVNLPNGIVAGFIDNTLYFCEPYAPYAWPNAYRHTLDFPIVGLGVFGGTLFIGTTGSPYFASGSDSASMSVVKGASGQACTSRRSIVSGAGGVFYASPDGLCFASDAGVEIVARGAYDRADWQGLSPSTMFCAIHEDIVYMFYDSGGTKGCITFDTITQKIGKITDLNAVTAAYVDRASDVLYVCSGSDIKSLFTTGARTAVWKTPKVTLAGQAPFVWAKVYGDHSVGTPVTFKWYGDGTLRHTATVTSTAPFRLPVGRWLEHEVEITSAANLTRVVMASTTEELQNV